MKIVPLNDYVVLEQVKEENKGGIYVPDEIVEKKPKKAKVIDIGSNVTSAISVGDYVMYPEYNFEEVDYGDGPFLIGKAENIKAILK